MTGRWWARIGDDDGLLLRAVAPADAAGVLAVHGDPEVYVLDPHERHADLAQSVEFVAPIVAHWATHGFGYWTVLVPRSWWPGGVAGVQPGDGDRVHAGLGGIRYHVLAGDPVLNVYFRLAPQVQGRGVAGRILAASVRAAPTVARDVDLVVRTRPANAAARRVASGVGSSTRGRSRGRRTCSCSACAHPTPRKQIAAIARGALPGSAPEDRCRVPGDLGEHGVDVRRRGEPVVLVEAQVAVAPVQRPRPGRRRVAQPDDGRGGPVGPGVVAPRCAALDDRQVSGCDLAFDTDLVQRMLGHALGAPSPDPRDVEFWQR